MQFIARKRRSTPIIIIISLIDVLLVLLIFLMVTTTFKQQPSVRLRLPESKQAKPGATENALVVTITKQGTMYLKTEPVTLDSLQQKLAEAVRINPQITLTIRADTDSVVGQMLKVLEAATAAHILVSSLSVKAAK
ncbi:MAG: biopolymer transporter ExbD [Verrucomicrobiota bacterium]|jgi:biopolymer transport protein ExbD